MKRNNLLDSSVFRNLGVEAQKEVRNMLSGKKPKVVTMAMLREMESEDSSETKYDLKGERIEVQIDFYKEAIKEKRQERYKKVAQMRSDGCTLEEIGIDLGITRERVRQLEKEMGLPPRTRQFWAKDKQKRICKCGQTFEVHSFQRKVHCSRDCWIKYRKIIRTPEEIRAKNNARTIAYYHSHKNDPKQIARLKRYRESERSKEYFRNWSRKQYAQKREKEKKRLQGIRDRLIERGFDPNKLKII